MNLPTSNQVNAGVRYTIAIVGTLITILGLRSKGIYLEQVKTLIEALGSVVNTIVTLLSAAAALWASYKGFNAASPTSQAVSLEAQGAVVVTTPEIAAATPSSPNVLSSTDVKVTPK